FVRGDRTAMGLNATPTIAVLRTKGALFTGTQQMITIPANQFRSIGNPYAAPLDMRNILIDGGINKTFYIWDPNLGSLGAYQNFNFNSSDGNYYPTPGGGSYPAGIPYNYIQSGQAFFLYANPAGHITFTEAAKADATAS